MAHKHSVYDTDAHLRIVPALRKIIGAENIKLVRGDHNSTRVTFEMPRYVDGHDMAETSIVEIHFINIASDVQNTNMDVYIASDVQLSPDSDDVVIFSWLISNNATKYDGTLSFMLCFKCLTGESLDYAWRTDTVTGVYVLESLDCVAADFEDITDILTAWEMKISGIEGRVDSIEDAYKQLRAEFEEANEQIKDDFDGLLSEASNALKATASGAKVTLDDISPSTHTPRVQLKSRNLISYPYSYSSLVKNGVTATVNADGSITLNGTATANSDFGLYNGVCFLPAGTYGVRCNGVISNVQLLGELYNGSTWITGFSDTTGNGKSFTLTDENVANATRLYICILVKSGATVNNLTLYPMIAKDTIPTEYTPYITDFTGLTLKRYGATEGEFLETYTANADGKVYGVTSIYPVMTLETGEAVTVEVEYNQDLQSVMDGKLDKVTETYWGPRLYGVTTEGEQRLYSLSWGASPDAVAIRATGGALAVGNPLSDIHAVPLGFANEHYLQKVENTTGAKLVPLLNEDGTQGQMVIGFGGTGASTLVGRLSNGEIRVGAPKVDNDAANKKFVEDKCGWKSGYVAGANEYIATISTDFSGFVDVPTATAQNVYIPMLGRDSIELLVTVKDADGELHSEYVEIYDLGEGQLMGYSLGRFGLVSAGDASGDLYIDVIASR